MRLIRKKLGLSLLSFSILTDLSKASIVNIENAKNGYNLNLLDNISNFTQYQLKELIDPDFETKGDIRAKLLGVYADNEQISSILGATPEIPYAIEQKVLLEGFLDEPKEISQIKKHLRNYNWEYKGTSISITLKRMADKVKIEQHPTKKNTFIYSKKN